MYSTKFVQAVAYVGMVWLDDVTTTRLSSFVLNPRFFTAGSTKVIVDATAMVVVTVVWVVRDVIVIVLLLSEVTVSVGEVVAEVVDV